MGWGFHWWRCDGGKHVWQALMVVLVVVVKSEVEKSEGEGGTVWGVCPRWRRRRGGAGVTRWQRERGVVGLPSGEE